MRAILGLFAFATTMTAATVALADEAPERVPVELHTSGEIRLRAGSWSSRCTAPCTLQVPPGFVEVSTELRSQEIFVERASRVTETGGAPGLRTAGGVMFLAGAAIVVAAVAIPLLVCKRGETRTDPTGRQVTDPSPCSDLSDGVKVAWIAGGGAGLTLAIAGGIVYVGAGPKLEVTEVRGSARVSPPSAFFAVRF